MVVVVFPIKKYQIEKEKYCLPPVLSVISKLLRSVQLQERLARPGQLQYQARQYRSTVLQYCRQAASQCTARPRICKSQLFCYLGQSR